MKKGKYIMRAKTVKLMNEEDKIMAKSYNVAIVGATGAVGIEMLQTLEKRNFPVATLKLLASARSVGKKFTFKGTEITVDELTKDSFKGWISLSFPQADPSPRNLHRPVWIPGV